MLLSKELHFEHVFLIPVRITDLALLCRWISTEEEYLKGKPVAIAIPQKLVNPEYN